MESTSTHSSLTAAVPVAVIVCSDRATSGEYEDRSGPAAREWLEARGYRVTAQRLIGDDEGALALAVSESLETARVVVVSGGTGLGPRDITPQTLDAICDYPIPGVGELLRAESVKYSRNAYLSRGNGYVKNAKLVLALPGNPRAVVEQLGILEPLLPSMLSALQGKCQHR